jgi:hypothetical protein
MISSGFPKRRSQITNAAVKVIASGQTEAT